MIATTWWRYVRVSVGESDAVSVAVKESGTDGVTVQMHGGHTTTDSVGAWVAVKGRVLEIVCASDCVHESRKISREPESDPERAPVRVCVTVEVFNSVLLPVTVRDAEVPVRLGLFTTGSSEGLRDFDGESVVDGSKERDSVGVRVLVRRDGLGVRECEAVGVSDSSYVLECVPPVEVGVWSEREGE